MSAKVKRVLVFLLAMASWALVWWLAGYNFDRRGPDVAYFFVVALLTSAFFPACFSFKDKV